MEQMEQMERKDLRVIRDKASLFPKYITPMRKDLQHQVGTCQQMENLVLLQEHYLLQTQIMENFIYISHLVVGHMKLICLSKEFKDLRVQLVQMVLRVPLVLKDQQDLRERLVPQVHRVQLVRMVLKDQQDLRERLVLKVPLVQMVPKVQLVPLVHRVQLVLKVQQDLRERLVPQVHKDIRVCLASALRDLKEQQVPQVLKAHPVQQALRDLKVHKAHQAPLAHKVQGAPSPLSTSISLFHRQTHRRQELLLWS